MFCFVGDDRHRLDRSGICLRHGCTGCQRADCLAVYQKVRHILLHIAVIDGIPAVTGHICHKFLIHNGLRKCVALVVLEIGNGDGEVGQVFVAIHQECGRLIFAFGGGDPDTAGILGIFREFFRTAHLAGGCLDLQDREGGFCQ